MVVHFLQTPGVQVTFSSEQAKAAISARFAAQRWLPVPISLWESSSPDWQIGQGVRRDPRDRLIQPHTLSLDWRGPIVALDHRVPWWSSKTLLKSRLRDSCSGQYQFLSWISSFLFGAWQYQSCAGLTPSSLPSSSAWRDHLAFFLEVNLEKT